MTMNAGHGRPAAVSYSASSSINLYSPPSSVFHENPVPLHISVPLQTSHSSEDVDQLAAGLGAMTEATVSAPTQHHSTGGELLKGTC